MAVTLYNQVVNTIRKNSPIPALAFTAFITGALIGAGWGLSAEVRLQSEWLHAALLAVFVLSAGRPRWLKAPETFTPAVAALRRA
jgi:hypothetical protein